MFDNYFYTFMHSNPGRKVLSGYGLNVTYAEWLLAAG